MTTNVYRSELRTVKGSFEITIEVSKNIFLTPDDMKAIEKILQGKIL